MTSPRKKGRKRSPEEKPRALVSACALGIPCRYDGSGRPELAGRIPGDVIPIPMCPEQLGGFPTPRPPARISEGDGRDVLAGRARVVDQDGQDVTEGFVRGAREAARIATMLGIKEAFLVEKSPSCGVNLVWTTSGLCPGMGVAAAAIAEHGVKLIGLGEPE